MLGCWGCRGEERRRRPRGGACPQRSGGRRPCRPGQDMRRPSAAATPRSRPAARVAAMSLTLLDWRRRVAALYAAARAARDPEQGWRTWRDGRDELFAGHPDSPLDEAARQLVPRAAVRALRPGAAVRGGAGAGGPAPAGGAHGHRRRGARSTGSARSSSTAPGGWTCGGWAATAAGSSCRCATAAPGRTTYGGGRYLLDTVKGADLGGDGGRLVVDLNFAYHPSCTYDPRWSCPLAPEGNRLADAGRRRGAVAPRRLVLTGRPDRVSPGRGRRRS